MTESVSLVKTDAVNAWGEKEVEEDGFIRAFHAYLNPGTLKRIDNSELEREVMRLNEAMPDSVSPKDAPKAITYTDKNGDFVVEDVKGEETEVFKIKRKMMLYFHGIRVRTVKGGRK